MSSDLSSIYRRKDVFLWVEDPTWKEYLAGAWGDDPRVGLLVAPGYASIQAVIEDARRDRVFHVYGLRDRDFSRANVLRWANLADDVRVFVPVAHEVENYLLDADALADLPAVFMQREKTDIESRFASAVSTQTWYMAVRRFLSEFRFRVGKLPSHPKPGDVSDQATAVSWVVDQVASTGWIPTVTGEAALLSDTPRMEASLCDGHAEYVSDRASGRWKETFSGKELLAAVYGHLVRPGSSRLDFFREVGATQRRLGRVPQEVQDLQDSLRLRVGLPLPTRP
jgi:hypothetical protein